ncbi:hypothetical protein [Bradyrhizobium neotropicale]|uniref:hypothetical protein n=1 Tax=Bradyrhizobium neotropicale TaxID=1497615 RepID=UPI001AD6535C|nr:hypothetical protein [Bradyrhizobium neotropicale]MBO4221762.1 hypothetical protein [Bradyrhizobium neotropicale]
MRFSPSFLSAPTRAVAVSGFLARGTIRQAIVCAERLATELRTVDGLFGSFPLNEKNEVQRAHTVDQRARVLADWLEVQAACDYKKRRTRSVLFSTALPLTC